MKWEFRERRDFQFLRGNKMKKILCILVVIFLIGCGQAFAGTVNLIDGKADSITGLTIGDIGTFDVEFIYGWLSEVFGPADIDLINNVDDARTAAIAINAALDDAGVEYIIDPTDGMYITGYTIAYNHDPGVFDFLTNYRRLYAGSTWTLDPISLTSGDNFGMHAVFTPTTGSSPVPIPSAMWLFGSGLVGLVGCRRKFKN